MLNRKSAALLLVLASIAAGAAALWRNHGSLDSRLRRWEVRFPAASRFALSDFDRQEVGKLLMEDLSAKEKGEGGRILKISRISGLARNEAENYLKEKETQFLSIYDQKPSPYFAVLKEKINCPEEFLPRIARGTGSPPASVTFSFFANDRLTYGSCTADAAAFRAQLKLILCDNKAGGTDFLTISFFSPNKGAGEAGEEKILETFLCGAG